MFNIKFLLIYNKMENHKNMFLGPQNSSKLLHQTQNNLCKEQVSKPYQLIYQNSPLTKIHHQDDPQIPKKQLIQKNKIKIINVDQQNDQGQLLDLNLMTRAINNSSLKRLSGDDNKFKSNQIVQMITDYTIKNMLKTSIYPQLSQKTRTQKQWKNYDQALYFVVDLDISSIQKQDNPVTQLLNCGKVSNNRNIDDPFNKIPLQSLELFSMVFDLGLNQIHFRALNSQKYMFFNIDTVGLTIESSHISHRQQQKWKYPIILKTLTKQLIQIGIYFTPRTLPFPMNKKHSNNLYLQKSHEHLQKFLNQILERSRGRNLQLKRIEQIILRNQYKFFQRRYATQEQFERYCQTGDILLFRGKHFFGKMQRFFTNSYYDHVGIVFKSQQYGICLFQSNSGLGVAMAIWRQLLRYKWYQGLQKISWRKLHCNEEKNSIQKKVAQFIKLNLNKQFKLNLAKLLKFKSHIGSVDGSNKQSYFCSQLVATVYKYLGLLQQQKSSTQYWPKDFSDGQGLKILNGALDAQRQLIFDDEVIKQRYPYIK